MLITCVYTLALFHPSSPVAASLPRPWGPMVAIAVAMGLSVCVLVQLPWSKRSGGHFNPAVTLTFWRLGKVRGADAAWYVAAQFAGALVGMLGVAAPLSRWLAHPAVNFAATAPGPRGVTAAVLAEAAMA